MVTLSVKNIGTDRAHFIDASMGAAGLSIGIIYTTFEDSCGVVPNTLSRELLPTFQTEIDVCWHIASSDADTLMMVWGVFASRVEVAVWFALS